MDENRPWFESRIGLDVPELDRKVAFCAHAIMEPRQALVVEDLLEDERFSGNALVAQAPHIRFYAGAPIVDPDDFALGTIAVIHARPRQSNWLSSPKSCRRHALTSPSPYLARAPVLSQKGFRPEAARYRECVCASGPLRVAFRSCRTSCLRRNLSDRGCAVQLEGGGVVLVVRARTARVCCVPRCERDHDMGGCHRSVARGGGAGS